MQPKILWLATTALFGALLATTAGRRTQAENPPAAPAPVSPEAAEFFETKIRPVLANSCYSCHGPNAQMGDLRVDSRAALLKGGASGASLVPGDEAKSLLVTAVHQTGKIKMPQGGRLKDNEIADIAAWVKMGAPWPDAKGAADAGNGEYVPSPAQKSFWSFQPVKNPTPPKVKNTAWVKSPIDAFVLAKLEAKGLTPAPPADKRTLIRRATYDLTGLPPTPAEIAAFAADKSPDAFARVVDRLLASPRYGETWARRWLDVARYADTKGYVFNEDRTYVNAYTYRDWVIHAFNSDLPYDEFIKEQIAADRLPAKNDDKRPLAALGFLTVGRRFLNNQPDIIDDRIDVTMRGFEGVTVACARCHNHKFDPIPTKDYYSLYGVFASSNESSPIISPKPIAEPYQAWQKKLNDAEGQERDTVMAQVGKLRERAKAGEALPKPILDILQLTRPNERPTPERLTQLEPVFEAGIADKLKSLRADADALRKAMPTKPEFAMGMEDAPTPVKQRIFKRGNPGNQGDDAPPRFLQILSPPNRPTWDKDSGRLELAEAIASKSNPLTARVFVNRVWLGHFGAGIVRTPSDFGKQGERPTHPELLDYLATKFMASGWSVKKLQRTMMLSATYQQDSDNSSPKAFVADPENRLLWRQNRRRLELEAMRDSLLSASGKLDTKTVGGPSMDIWAAPFPTRRTLYGFIDRQNLPGIYRTFNLASPDTTSPQRFQTTVPQQALFLMNSPFVGEQARALAAAAVQSRPDDAGRVRVLYQRLYGRLPDADEVKFGLQFVRQPSASTAAELPVWRYGWGAFDAAAQRVAQFTPFPFFDNRGWHASAAFPDPKLSFLVLTADGGHPGFDAAHAVIRRWTARADGTVAVTGTLKHGQADGDGVRARLVSSRTGLLGEWTAHHSETKTDAASIVVKRGDTLDFVTDCVGNEGFDGFTWSPTIATGGKTWSAAGQFSGPDAPFQPMTGWERYAQALLMTNEFLFVD